MSDFKIGIMVDSLRLGIKEGILKARELGAAGLQLYATHGEMSFENLSTAKRKELLDMVRSNGLVISALCGDLGGHGFAVPADNPLKIEKSKRILDLAKDLDTFVVTTHIGVVPQDTAHPRYKILQEACEQLGEYGDDIGAYFAIETGPETTATLKRFLDSLHSRSVCVNYDPANLVMVTGDDAVAGVYILKDYIVHTHAKDGIMKQQSDPERIYNFFAEGGIEDLRLEDYFLETPLGQGHVNFPDYLRALKEIGFDGFLTIEREVGTNPEKDIGEAVEFLKKFL